MAASLNVTVGVAAAVVPPAALAVPYNTQLPLHDSLPWRAPVAWGWGTIEGVGFVPLQLVFGFGPTLLALGYLGSFAWGGVQAWRARQLVRKLRTIAVRRSRRNRLLVVPDAAFPMGSQGCSIGLFRPTIVVAEKCFHGPDAKAVIAHEVAHVRSRHSLGTWTVACVTRVLWWIPGMRSLLRDVELSAELSADDSARGRLNAPEVARALRRGLEAETVRRPHAGAVAFGESFLLARATALCRSPIRNHRASTTLIIVLTVLVSILLVTLL